MNIYMLRLPKQLNNEITNQKCILTNLELLSVADRALFMRTVSVMTTSRIHFVVSEKLQFAFASIA